MESLVILPLSSKSADNVYSNKSLQVKQLQSTSLVKYGAETDTLPPIAQQQQTESVGDNRGLGDNGVVNDNLVTQNDRQELSVQGTPYHGLDVTLKLHDR